LIGVRRARAMQCAPRSIWKRMACACARMSCRAAASSRRTIRGPLRAWRRPPILERPRFTGLPEQREGEAAGGGRIYRSRKGWESPAHCAVATSATLPAVVPPSIGDPTKLTKSCSQFLPEMRSLVRPGVSALPQHVLVDCAGLDCESDRSFDPLGLLDSAWQRISMRSRRMSSLVRSAPWVTGGKKPLDWSP